MDAVTIEKTPPGFRWAMEHFVRILRHPDRLCAAECEHEPDLPDAVAGRPGHSQQAARAVGRRAADRAAGPADHRPYVRPYLARTLGPSQALFPDGRHHGSVGAARDAACPCAVICGGDAVGARRVAQYLDGAVPRVRRRYAAQGPTQRRLCGADCLYRRGCCGRIGVPQPAGTLGRVQCRAGRPDTRHGQVRFLVWGRRIVPVRAVDDSEHARIQPGADDGIRRCGRRR